MNEFILKINKSFKNITIYFEYNVKLRYIKVCELVDKEHSTLLFSLFYKNKISQK